MFSQFPEASFGWSRYKFKGEPKLEKDLLDKDYNPLPGSVEGKPTFEDYKWNGQHCKSGVAFYNPDESKESAECADPEKMWVYQENSNGDLVLLGAAGESTGENANWQCDPTDNTKPCIFYFRGDPKGDGKDYENYNFEVPCKCSLATVNKGGDPPEDWTLDPPNWVPNPDVPQGYCGSILGTLTYQNALVELKRMLEKSDCHSLDRHDYSAQLDCNSEFDAVKKAVKAMFEMNYWPYVQDDDVR